MSLNKLDIRKLASKGSFDRGKNYYTEGRVENYHQSGDVINAQVFGTETYKVTVNTVSLEASCDCYAFSTYEGYCKHIVAVLLTYFEGSRGTDTKNQIPLKDVSIKPLSSYSKKDLLKFINKHIPNAEEVLHKEAERLSRANKKSFSKKELRSIKKDVKACFKGIRFYRDSYDWSRYQNDLYSAVGEAAYILKDLQKNMFTMPLFLDLTYWIEEKLLIRHDDSDGTLGDFARELLLWSTDCTKDKSIPLKNYTAIISKFTNEPEHSFGFDSEFASYLITNTKNKDLYNFLQNEIEKSKPSTVINTEYLLGYWVISLRKKDVKKYETLCLKYLESNSAVKKDYINYLYKKKRYKEVVKYFSDDDWNINEDIYKISLRKTADKTTYLNYLIKAACKDYFSLKNYDEIISFAKDSFCNSEFKNIEQKVYKIAEKNLKFNDLCNLHLRYKEYKKLVILLKSSVGKGYYVDTIISKLEILDRHKAIEVYKEVLNYWLVRIKDQHYSTYNDFIKTYLKLQSLGESKYLKHVKKDLLENHPTKKKLVAWLKEN